jgi:glycosyltransferase involved in cell wall biosynthesis
LSKHPEISVVMSVYNGARFLRESIDSVLQQSFTNFEFIIVNDGSTDESLSIIKSFNDDRILLIENEGNKGLIYSLNKGFSVAKGKYIARLDADDLCFSNRLSIQFEFMETHPEIGVVGSDYINFSSSFSRNCSTLKNPEILKAWLLFATPLCHPSVMIRSNVLAQEINPYDQEFLHVEDYELWTRIALNTGLDNIAKPLLRYRHHPAQISQRARAEQLKGSKEIQRRYLSRLGFRFVESDIDLHNYISSGIKIQSSEKLFEIRNWLENLRQQNETTQVFNSTAFTHVLGRIFYEVCGNTNLGLKAYFFWRESELKNFYGNNFQFQLRQLLKCIFRKFR